MKKTLAFSIIALFLGTAINSGCSKTPDGTVYPKIDFDVSNFTINNVSAFLKGASSLVSIASTTLADGAYTVYFDLSGANNISNASAILNLAGDVATFSTPVLANEGNTNITIKKIVNSSGTEATFSAPVTKTFSDSSGLMTFNITGSSPYRATHVNATWLMSGGMLSIHAVYWDPLTNLTLYWDDYTGTTGTRYFNAKVNVPGAWNSLYNGGATYSAPGKSAFDAHGSITVTNKTAATITGTFSVVLEDSTQITSGAFHCKLN